MPQRRHTFSWTLVIGLLFATVSCGEATSEDVDAVDGVDDSFLAPSGKGDHTVPEENSGEARAILEVVNTYSLHGLVQQAGLYWRGARHIIDYRNGEDGVRNTDDDQMLRSMAALDDVPYIGKKSLKALREYVDEEDLIADHTIHYEKSIPAKMSTTKGAAFAGTISARDLLRIELESEPEDRILLWLRKAGSAKWNPKIKLIERTTGETIAWANPWGLTDARLPESVDEASRGFEIGEESSDLTVVLDNTSDVDGEFEFLLECVGGPCYDAPNRVALDGNFDDLRGDELREQMVGRHELTHTYIDYHQARQIMFEELDNDDGYVECVYTGERVQTNTIPSNLVMNAEHTWPQSEGAVDGAARSDLHHLYPVMSAINSVRSAHSYCEVAEVLREEGGSLYGDDHNGERCFEPRDDHKGDAARAMFYVAAVYQLEIDEAQEDVLRRWSELDGVDRAERQRNDAIENIQGSRNFFVDDPDLVDRIDDF